MKQRITRHYAHAGGRTYPSLTQPEAETYNRFLVQYDRRGGPGGEGTVRPSEFNPATLRKLEGLGYLRVQGNRVIPSFIIQEGKVAKVNEQGIRKGHASRRKTSLAKRKTALTKRGKALVEKTLDRITGTGGDARSGVWRHYHPSGYRKGR